MFAFLIALQVAAAQPAPALAPVVQPSGRIAKILKKGDGRSQATAFRVMRVREEYDILHVLGLEPSSQALIVGTRGKPFDLIRAKNPQTGEVIELWFDISSFYGFGL